jgi:hypothetical protein
MREENRSNLYTGSDSAMSRKIPLLSLNVWMVSSECLKLFISLYHRSIHLVCLFSQSLVSCGCGQRPVNGLRQQYVHTIRLLMRDTLEDFTASLTSYVG